MSITYKDRRLITNVNNNIKTYKLVEITANAATSTGPVCPLKPHQTFNIGGKYKIITRVLEKLFVCKAYIDVLEENPNICLDVVIMKQIGGPGGTLWTLSESDCEFLHIEYENGLLVFPASYDFKAVK